MKFARRARRLGVGKRPGVERVSRLPPSILAAVPALYAWQMHGWTVGAIAFLVVYGLIFGVGFAAIHRDWPARQALWARAGIVLAAFVLIGISGAESCDPGPPMVCHRVFGG